MTRVFFTFNRKLAPFVEHVLLPRRPDGSLAPLSEDDLSRMAYGAMHYGFRGVCVPACSVGSMAQALRSTPYIVPVAVVGSLYDMDTALAVRETHEAGAAGAREVEVVFPHRRYLAGNYSATYGSIEAVVKAATEYKMTVTVILEAHRLVAARGLLFLQDTAMLLAFEGRAHGLSTCTGLTSGGATVEMVRAMRRGTHSDFPIKASGGIRTADDARRMIEAGATFVGSHTAVGIVIDGYAHV